jgi:hypothetical protein
MKLTTASLHAMIITLAVSLASLASAVAADRESATGIVFEDRNGNGQRDAGEPGIAGVVVSNQREVVVTDADGRYELPVTDDTIIFVCKPSGYRLPVNQLQLPQFYHIHKPGGSPKLYYGGVPATGPLPASIDFPLVKAAEPKRFRVVVLADPQPETTEEVQFVRDDVLDELVGVDAAFGITLGDIVANHLYLYRGYNDAVSKVGIPFFNIVGNHDLDTDAANDRDSDETFHRHFGPNYCSWNYGNVHFVALDTVEWQGSRYRGAIGDQQLAWLAEDLKHVPKERLIVLGMHIPIWDPGGRDCHDRQQLLDLLEDRARVLALTGHNHQHLHTFFTSEQGWHGAGQFHQLMTAAVSGSWWSGPKDVRGIPVSDNRDGVPNGYVFVSFDGNSYVTDLKPASLDREFRMRIYPPDAYSLDEPDRRRLLVNVFDGSDRCKVEFSLDSASFIPMAMTPQPDPFAVSFLSGVRRSAKPWGRPIVCQHMWLVELPEQLAARTHVVTIRVTDHFGRVYEQSRIFGR